TSAAEIDKMEASLNDEIENLRKTADSVVGSNEEYENKIAALRAKCEKADEELAKASATLDEATAEYEAEITRIQSMYDEKAAECEELKRQLCAAEEKVTEAEASPEVEGDETVEAAAEPAPEDTASNAPSAKIPTSFIRVPRGTDPETIRRMLKGDK
ncbi:MAG: hypothetical protein IJQ80_06700, partial [Clostridia bacterium]|nr:hypothetical protein [Clostridia bacterium]